MELLNRPFLFIPGAAKSGTSSLHEYIGLHPNVSMSAVKEPHFWLQSHHERYRTQKTYHELFTVSEKTQIVGESSTGYMVFPEFITSIKDQGIKGAKFIFLLRNPIDRAYSHYTWLKGLGYEHRSFIDAVLTDMDEEPEIGRQFVGGNYKYYFQFGLYSKWIEKFYDAFGSENVLVLTSECLRASRNTALEECFEFLRLEPLKEYPVVMSNPSVVLKNPGIYKGVQAFFKGNSLIKRSVAKLLPLSVRDKLKRNAISTVHKQLVSNDRIAPCTLEDRNSLRDFYYKDVATLRSLCGQSFSEWKDFTIDKN